MQSINPSPNLSRVPEQTLHKRENTPVQFVGPLALATSMPSFTSKSSITKSLVFMRQELTPAPCNGPYGLIKSGFHVYAQ